MANPNMDLKINEGAPESLMDITLKYLVENIDILYHATRNSTFTKSTKGHKVEKFPRESNESLCYNDMIYEPLDPSSLMSQSIPRGDLRLPSEVCERLLEVTIELGNDVSDKFSAIFTSVHHTRLKYVTIRNSTISDAGIQNILNHDLISVSLDHCDKLTKDSLDYINKHSKNLKTLAIGFKTTIIPSYTEHNWSQYKIQDFVIHAPQLRKLSLRSLALKLPLLLNNLKDLTHLDLSECIVHEELEYLEMLGNLNYLVLYNVKQINESIPALCKLKSLRCLDISQANERSNTFEDENQVLSKLVESLPDLVHLDISGTNLAGTGVAQTSSVGTGLEGSLPTSDIPGLSSRVNRPLEFLGLYGTAHAACRRHDIPAKTISGDANEQQILIAAEVYQERPDLLTKVLNDLYHLLRFETCTQVAKALEAVLSAMDRHVVAKHIQISGSATLFYIVKGKDKANIGVQMRRHIIRSLLNGMAMHLRDDTMMRNGCLTLCQFKIPQDVLFQYEKLVQILLHGVSDTEQEGFVQRIAIYLLNSLACQVDGTQKQCLGDMGAISKMLWLISDRLHRQVCDDVLEVAWSTMWNVTDETAVNCRRFLDGKGMDYFLECLKCFPDKEELLRNMMGLLGNVAEVRSLRFRLMTSQFIAVFSDLLDSCSDGIEVSYNAAGVLSHIASDGPEIWIIDIPRREDVLNRMVAAIERWDLGTERNINYRSFEPILYLIRTYETPQCQHWAAWALANLTKVYPLKYCSLVEAEGGLMLLEELLAHPLPYFRVKELASMVVENCRKQRQSLGDPMVLEG